MLALIDSCLYL